MFRIVYVEDVVKYLVAVFDGLLRLFVNGDRNFEKVIAGY